jgi:hypothetical protein
MGCGGGEGQSGYFGRKQAKFPIRLVRVIGMILDELLRYKISLQNVGAKHASPSIS